MLNTVGCLGPTLGITLYVCMGKYALCGYVNAALHKHLTACAIVQALQHCAQ